MKKSDNTPSDQFSRLTEDSFADEFQRCYPRLWVIAAAMVCDRATTDDILQEAALVGLRKLSQFQVGTKFDAWMATIVRFVAANHRRKTANRRTHTTEPARLDALSHHGAEDLHPRDFQDHLQGRVDADHTLFDDRVRTALKSLGETARACLLLRVIHGLPFDEISELLEIPKGTAMSHVHRSRTTLREKLTGYD